MSKYHFGLLFLFTIAGCSSAPTDVDKVPYTFEQEDLVSVAIADALGELATSASKAANANLMLAQLRAGSASLSMSEEEYREYLFQREYVPKGMEHYVDLMETGSPLPMIEMLAALSGYQIAQPAYRPMSLPTVSIDTSSRMINEQYFGEHEMRIIDVLWAIDAAVGEAMHIKIHEGPKIIEVNYK